MTREELIAGHFPTGLRQRRYEIAKTREPVNGPVMCECHCGAAFSGSDEQEARQLWAEHVAALADTPKPNARLVEELREDFIRADYEWHGPFGNEKHRIIPPALFDRILSALEGDRS